MIIKEYMIEFEILQNKLRDLISRAYTSFARKIKADSELYEAVMFYSSNAKKRQPSSEVAMNWHENS